jgi:hypothetical protein
VTKADAVSLGLLFEDMAVRLGFRREGCLRGTCIGSDPGPGDLLVFGMLRDEFESSPAAAVPVEAFDAAGRSLVV